MTRDEADGALRAAIQDHAEAYGFAEDDELLSEYAVVAHWQRVEADGTSLYTVHYHQTPCPTHVATGLFRVGESLVSQEPDRS